MSGYDYIFSMSDMLDWGDNARDDFVDGWRSAGGYIGDVGDVDCPWCMPWTYAGEIKVNGGNAYEWGAYYWQSARGDVEAELAAQAELGNVH